MPEALNFVALLLVPLGIYAIWRWRRRTLFIEDILYLLGFFASLAAIFYIPSEFAGQLSKLGITVVELAIALLCISLGYFFEKR